MSCSFVDIAILCGGDNGVIYDAVYIFSQVFTNMFDLVKGPTSFLYSDKGFNYALLYYLLFLLCICEVVVMSIYQKLSSLRLMISFSW